MTKKLFYFGFEIFHIYSASILLVYFINKSEIISLIYNGCSQKY